MVIDQRNAGASYSTGASPTTYTMDRWLAYANASGKYTVQQSSTAPAGFASSLKVTSSSAYSVPSGQIYGIAQYIEGYNIVDLSFGSSSAKTITISFWVQSSLTGTFGASIINGGYDRSYPFTYTINSANTWEYKTVVIPGDTAGTWLTTNGVGIRIWFSLGIGSTFSGTAGTWAAAEYESVTGATSVVGTSGATFYLTGVQLEIGTVPTAFELRSYSKELMMCQRYYLLIARGTGELGIGTVWGASDVRTIIPTPVTMRSTPTVSASNNTNDFIYYCGGNVRYSNTVSFDTYGLNVIEIISSTLSGTLTTGFSAMVRAANGTSFLAFSAEL
jgi:hypothetical protein